VNDKGSTVGMNVREGLSGRFAPPTLMETGKGGVTRRS